jgi:hypothetical protein
MKATVPRGFNLGADDYVVKPARGSVAVSHAVIAEGDVLFRPVHTSGKWIESAPDR